MYSLSLKSSFLVAVAALSLAGCAVTAPAPNCTSAATQGATQEKAQGLNVQKVNVVVPRSLSTSEANNFIPDADIVWHGQAVGDRHAQVEAILTRAMSQGAADFKTGRAVVADVELVRFHAVTPLARATVGGRHGLFYTLTLKDAVTGELLIESKRVNASVHATGGDDADAEIAAGRTQMVVIQESLAQGLSKELARFVAAQAKSGGALPVCPN